MNQGIEQGKVYPPFEDKKAQAILVTSFFLSQGSTVTQSDIFRYIHRIRPEWNMDNALFTQLIQDKKFEEKIFTIVLSNGKRHPTRFTQGKEIDINGARSGLLEEIYAMRRHFNGDIGDTESANDLIATLAWTIIGQDHHHIVEKGGRTRDHKNLENQDDTPLPYDDPFHSHFCYYVLAANLTDIPELDQMFTDIRRSFPSLVASLEPKNRERIKRELGEVIKVYNQHHPNSNVSTNRIDKIN